MHGFARIGSDKKTPQYVVDASVVVKWVLSGEQYEANAAKLKNAHVSGLAPLCAPSFMVDEVANSLWKAIKRGAIRKEKAQEGLSDLGDLNLKLYELNWSRASEVLNVACRIDCTVYDAAYVFLSDKIGAQLVTADDKLYNKAKDSCNMLHIKDY